MRNIKNKISTYVSIIFPCGAWVTSNDPDFENDLEELVRQHGPRYDVEVRKEPVGWWDHQ
jgi:hypothetical protein